MRLILIFLTFCLADNLCSQTNLESEEKTLKRYLAGLSGAADDSERSLWNDSIHEFVSNLSAMPEVFLHEFTVKKMGILKSPDKKFMMFNWNLPLDDGGSEFFCFVVLPKEERNKVVELETYTREPKKIETRYLEPESWYGALYYDIIPVKKGKKTSYTLLGYSPSEKFITTKYIDVLTIKNDEVQLGAPVFKTEKGTKKRLIFKYSSEVSMTIRYQESSNRIIIDHLVPRLEGMSGNYQFYGPDGTFDSYVLVKNVWEFRGDVEYKSDTKSNKRYKDPRSRRN